MQCKLTTRSLEVLADAVGRACECPPLRRVGGHSRAEGRWKRDACSRGGLRGQVGPPHPVAMALFPVLRRAVRRAGRQSAHTLARERAGWLSRPSESSVCGQGAAPPPRVVSDPAQTLQSCRAPRPARCFNPYGGEPVAKPPEAQRQLVTTCARVFPSTRPAQMSKTVTSAPSPTGSTC